MTSMRRRYVASTSLRRHVPAGNLAPLPPPPPQYSKPCPPPNILNFPTPMKTYNIDRDCATGATHQCLYWLIICQTLFQPVLDCKTLLFDLKIITVTGFHFPMFMLVSTLSMRPLSTPRINHILRMKISAEQHTVENRKDCS